MNNAWIGCDPGKTGCLTILSDNDIVTFFDYPKDENLINYFDKINSALLLYNIKLAVLEQVGAMPNQGIVSMFNFGKNYGQWLAFFSLNKISFKTIRPSVWMKGLVPKSDKKDTKDSIRDVVSKLYPNAELYGPKGGYMSGRGDSLLLAHYTKLQLPQT